MATSFTYAALKLLIEDHVEDHGTDFDSNVDKVVQLGEDRILKDLPLTIFEGRANVAISQGNQVAPRPAGCITAHSIYYTSGGVRTVLTPKRYTYLIAVVNDVTQRAPRWFANDYAEDQLWIAPNPNLSVTAEALMTKRPTSLVTATSGTWLSQNLGDLLLAASMVVAERLNLGWDESKEWGGDYNRLLASARVEYAALLRLPYLGG